MFGDICDARAGGLEGMAMLPWGNRGRRASFDLNIHLDAHFTAPWTILICCGFRIRRKNYKILLYLTKNNIYRIEQQVYKIIEKNIQVAL